MDKELSPKQRKQFRAQAHSLGVSVQVGKLGLSDALIEECNQALNAHELIKIQFVSHKERKTELALELAERVSAQLCGITGNRAILYRELEEKERPSSSNQKNRG